MENSLPTHEVRAIRRKFVGDDGSASAELFAISLTAVSFQAEGTVSWQVAGATLGQHDRLKRRINSLYFQKKGCTSAAVLFPRSFLEKSQKFSWHWWRAALAPTLSWDWPNIF